MSLRIDRASGWIEHVRKVRSPNCDARPLSCPIDLIVIHGISLPPGRFGGRWIDRLFRNELPAAADPSFASLHGLRVSAHVLIDRRGRLTQYVPFGKRAWHAGKSEHRGRSACNDFSIGIELEGADRVPYRPAQYAALVELVRALRLEYASLRKADIVGHSDIAPGRKSDPGPAFNWRRFRRLLRRRSLAPRGSQRCQSVSSPPPSRASRRATTNSRSESLFT
jgi:AmpD protein